MAQQRDDGPTSHGGVYTIAYFSDAKGKPSSKEDAQRIEIIEYDSTEKEVWRTYMEKGNVQQQ